MLKRFGLGPVFVYESLLAARRWQVYAGRSLFVFVLLIGIVIVWIGKNQVAVAVTVGRRPPTLQMMARLGQGFFYALTGIQISLVMLAAPAAAAGAVCMDRARGTLLHMFVTDLSDSEIVLGKLGARLTPIIGMIACGVPVAALAALLGGIDFGALAGAFVVSLALTVLGCALALTISVWAAKTHEVLMAVYLIEGLCLLALPIWWVLAGRAGPGPPAWFEKANPYVLVFAPYNKPGFVSAVDYEVFVGVVLAFSAMLVALAIARLRPVVVAQSGRAEDAGRRLPQRVARLFPTLIGPSLDGNPVLWREWHRNRPSRLGRHIWAGLMVVTALLAAWGTYDLALHGNAPGRGPGGLGLAMILQLTFGFLILSATAPTVFADERVRGSLDVLLATPLSTRSIVVGKWWGVFRRVFVLAAIPLYVFILIAATTPALPSVTPGLRMSNELTQLMPWERILAPVLSGADFFASGALLVSVGVAIATWVPRLSRAVALSVIAFFALGIGLPFLVEMLFSLLRVGQGQFLQENRWVMMSVVSLSPIVGPVHPLDILSDYYSPGGRAPQWIAAGVVLFCKLMVAAMLFALTVSTFDRCMGRVSESTVPGAQDAPDAR